MVLEEEGVELVDGGAESFAEFLSWEAGEVAEVTDAPGLEQFDGGCGDLE